MSDYKPALRASWVISALAFAGLAQADFLAADPGTPVSVQVNQNGSLVVRPVGGTWTHPLCSDVSGALLLARPYRPLLINALIAAAANGSIVNIEAEAESCSVHGYPLVRNIRIQGA